jgi:hypothetical protein
LLGSTGTSSCLHDGKQPENRSYVGAREVVKREAKGRQWVSFTNRTEKSMNHEGHEVSRRF